MRKALHNLPRFLATPRVSKHRLFAWLSPEVLCDSAVVTFARDDDYFFGVLHSRLHEVWALKLGTQLEDRPRYTPTSCFETFPFPLPSDEQRAAIADAARVLDERRQNWLQPPEWMREETLEVRGSIDGAWRRFVTDADANGIGTVRYSRQVPRDPNMSVPIVRDGVTSAARLRRLQLVARHERRRNFSEFAEVERRTRGLNAGTQRAAPTMNKVQRSRAICTVRVLEVHPKEQSHEPRQKPIG